MSSNRSSYIAALNALSNHTGPVGLVARGLLTQVNPMGSFARSYYPAVAASGSGVRLTWPGLAVDATVYQRPTVPPEAPGGARPAHLAVVFDPPLSRQVVGADGDPWGVVWGSFALVLDTAPRAG